MLTVELTKVPEDEVTRFIKVVLFCTQAAAHQRPTMKQVVEMLSKQVQLNDKALTKPGVYRAHGARHSGGASSEETSSSQAEKGKQSANRFEDPIQSNVADFVTEMFPRCRDGELQPDPVSAKDESGNPKANGSPNTERTAREERLRHR
ncbi:hypothetical protein L484_001573 [Morus notabilis]|uniref:LRR receptor-like serine/threonine-protein kinase n=1 Tax=Morus notabilis TaxID=981085 RepID=W9SFL2_9ROSA|nr:hypothetical protein L484_001573 [Morus notabilis]